MDMSAELKQLIGDQSFDFYACYKCGRLLTAIELVRALHRNGQPCPCGCQKIMPADLRWWQWMYPRVLYFAFLRIRGIA